MVGPGVQGSQASPDDLDLSNWRVLSNPKIEHVLDVQLVHELFHDSVVCCVKFSADGKYLATGCNRKTQIYDTTTGAKTCVLIDQAAGPEDLYIRSVRFSPDGKLLATGAEDKLIRIWDIAKRCILRVLEGHQHEIYCIDFSPDGRFIVSGSGDNTVRIWDMDPEVPPKVLPIEDPGSPNGHAGITSVAFSPNGLFVAAGSLDSLVRIWAVATGYLVGCFSGHTDSVYSVAFTPDGKGLVSGSLDKTLKYWDIGALVVGSAGPSSAATNPCKMDFTGHTDYVLSVTVSHDGRWVVSGSKDRSAHIWDARSAVVQCILLGHQNSVISTDLSPTGGLLATGSGDWYAIIWKYGEL